MKKYQVLYKLRQRPMKRPIIIIHAFMYVYMSNAE